ncbi:methylmalonyl Co-A mutase-associated GTPase MeaB [Pricia sp. S334]|uniref:Methylmalonyl Co-A mutase-associated GTPase MeaB n=1 Tax=Pricia mediterranea TaxID=3076079 RepID=A0ABU3L815_9FLAO|nr:methylmalonyl Co-A mutase-associated GTPase MeaB [Pricia sp. S334]MDT7829822.1 methylmalonyl Co-A mutase-associated GTPase MeaB [Pricia sp. S334]
METDNHIRGKRTPKGQGKKQPSPSADDLVEGILKGDTAALGKAITLIESNRDDHHQIANNVLQKCLSQKKESIRIGITGVPGVGKSTFIETLGGLLTEQGNRVAVLAVDPTSSQSKGSIMGDKTRMEALVKNPRAFIRPSPSGELLGGVARKTRESTLLCEAAGYNIVLIETVGVGQSETAVHGMVDFFLLLKLSGAGDELQGIKRGIVEMADAIVINKADGDNIKRAEAAAKEFKKALHLYPPKPNGWTPKTMTCSATENTGIEAVWEMIRTYIEQTRKTGHFKEKRKQQNRNWLFETIGERLKSEFFQSEAVRPVIKKFEAQVMAGTLWPFQAAEQLIGRFKNKS